MIHRDLIKRHLNDLLHRDAIKSLAPPVAHDSMPLERLPTDYVLMIQTLGAFEIMNYYFILDVVQDFANNAATKSLRTRLESSMQRTAWITSLGVYPDDPGLLPFGGDYEGGLLAWWTAKPEWPVVIIDADLSKIKFVSYSLIEWIIAETGKLLG